ncbi:MAG: hypothetical protein IJS09_01530 [Treponema sp.]|nr:hypothetical protein [Treponema sp.]
MDCYCIMVKTGAEEQFKTVAAEKLGSSDATAQFYFFKKQMHARAGTNFLEPLFPGYIFMETENLEVESVEALKKIKGFYHFLFSNDSPQKLQGYDLDYFERFRRSGELLGLSKVTFDKDQRIVIVGGPLKGFEGNIIRVNRRCRRVTVEIDMFGYSKKVDLCYADAEAV